MNSISIIIASTGEKNFLEKCLQSIDAIKEQMNMEIIVTTAIADDPCIEILEQRDDIIGVLLPLGTNQVSQYNIATEYANPGNDVLFLDVHTFLLQHTLQNLQASLSINENLGAVCGETGYFSNFQDCIEAGEKRNLENTDVDIKNVVPFGCLLIKREAFIQVGFFDESYPSAAYADYDYCLRMLEQNIFCGICHQALLYSYNIDFWDFGKDTAGNLNTFAEKWGLSSNELEKGQKELLQDIREHRELLKDIQDHEYDFFKQTANGLLHEKNENAVNLLIYLAHNKFVLEKFCEQVSFLYLLLAGDIYLYEKSRKLEFTVFSKIRSLEELEAKLLKYKLLIYNIDFDVDQENAIDSIQSSIKNGMVSEILIQYFIEKMSMHRDRTSKAIWG